MLTVKLPVGSPWRDLCAALLATTALLGCAAGSELTGGGDDDDEGLSKGGAARGAPTPHKVAYPTGQDFGVDAGAYVKPGLKWSGFRDRSDVVGEVTIEEYYDPDGFKGYDALVLISATTYCTYCRQEAANLNELVSETGQWGSHGKVKVVTLMLEDNAAPATIETAKKWKDEFGLASAVVADPGFSVTGYGSFGTPLKVLVDPRTMRIVARTEGKSPTDSYPELISLLDKNSASD